MFNSVLSKTMYEKRWSATFWTLGLIAAAALTMVFYHSFNQSGIDQIIGSVPDSLKSLIGSVQSFKTVPGYLAQQIYGPNLLIVVIAMAVIVFLSLSSGDEDRGTLQTVLMLPVSRRRVYLSKLAAGFIIMAVTCLGVTVGAWLGLAGIGESASAGRLLESTLALWLLACCYGAITFGLAMATGKRGLSIGLASSYAFASFLVTSLAPAVAGLHLADRFSLLHYYLAHPVMTDGIHWYDLAALAAITAAAVALSLPVFTRRDVNTG